MTGKTPLLSAALAIFGVAFLLLLPLGILWPSGWAWHQGSPLASDYYPMIIAFYSTLGIFMIRAAKDPAANASLIWLSCGRASPIRSSWRGSRSGPR